MNELHDNTVHYLTARYITKRADGVHVEARCICGVKLEGVGSDESKALEEKWANFKEHSWNEQGHSVHRYDI